MKDSRVLGPFGWWKSPGAVALCSAEALLSVPGKILLGSDSSQGLCLLLRFFEGGEGGGIKSLAALSDRDNFCWLLVPSVFVL